MVRDGVIGRSPTLTSDPNPNPNPNPNPEPNRRAPAGWALMAGGTRKAVHVEEEAKIAPEKVKNASRERGKGVWNRQGQVTLRVANPVVVSTHIITSI